MFLKEIKCQGFKSFAEKIDIELNNGITGIVGPNGSGKSNVVDAVKWVLGEQSIKSLRGSLNMTDVIFAGSKSRPAMNTASVTLVFDNQDNYLKLPYNEISVKRRLYKDGTNEFFINEEKVRLKDIIDLFMDSGIGKDSFNIISQGKIDEILSNKMDRRVVFEEAAVVLKYKKRKEEALKKLEKTNINLDRVNDIVKELETQVEPLKIQKEKAIQYKKMKSELEEVEVSLIVDDITNLNYTYQDKQGIIENLKNDILSLSTANSNQQAIVEQYKLKINNALENIQDLNQQLLQKTSQKEQLNSEKNIIIERQKYLKDNEKIKQRMIEQKENEYKKQEQINKIEIEINTINKEIYEEEKKLNEQNIKNNDLIKEKQKLDSALSALITSEAALKNEINILTNLIENNSNIPAPAKRIMDNPKLQGIHNILGNLIEVEEEYSIAISTALGQQANYLITDTSNDAKKAIEYLKQNNIGRQTFLPIEEVKSKNINNDILEIAKKHQGFIGIASKLVTYEKRYENIIINQLGNTIVMDNIDNATNLAKKINHSMRIVTKEGELLNIGGSITGGKIKTRNVITDKYELDKKNKELEKIISNIKEIELNMNNLGDLLRGIDDTIYLTKRKLIEKQTIIDNKNEILNMLVKELKDIQSEINSSENIMNNKLDEEIENIMNKYYNVSKEVDILNSKLEEAKKLKDNLTDTLNDYEFTIKKDNAIFSSKNEQLKNLEIEVNRIDVKLDTLLNTLNENYSITYEKASTLYHLEIDEKQARSKVLNLKRLIKELGQVNPEAEEEYEKVKTRYEFLLSQSNDLVEAINTLNEIIKQMDDVMVKEFTKTFKQIREKFQETFKELFKGGNADLILTDSTNILETGIDIIASPPGKSLKNINALSGGEKTFTAISLLFAILKTRTMPFCILDEVEAALDEANVDAFGRYLKKLQTNTQFILITHKKKTMEYANYLYGITMQESGVSKLVSVKLEEI
ncbi:MAG: AAA family ATPase [Bacilli bacterium]|nr:AAA family ATPase [Bacilli bacterium]